MDTKKVIPTICDVDTGEILYQIKDGQGKYFQFKTFNIGDFESAGEGFLKKIYDCFIRGIKQGRNLSLQITVRDYKLPEQKDIF